MSHIERKKRDKENTRNSILKAALDIAIAKGWQSVTIRKISEAIEYTTSIVYGHFDSKEALFHEIRDSGFDLLYKQFEKIHDEETDPKKQLMKLSLINWDFAQNNKELYNLMFFFGKPSSEVANKGLTLINDIFIKLTGKTEDEVDSLVLNWICLRQGAINLMMNFQGNNSNAREIYIEFIDRFISSIS